MALALDFQSLTLNLTPSWDQISGSFLTPGPSSSRSDGTPPSLPCLTRALPILHPHLPCSCLPGCGKLTGVSNPITIRAMGSRFGSWMTDTMAPSADSRVSDYAHPGVTA